MRTKGSQRNTLGLRLVGETESGSASTIYGPVRAGLTTSPVTNKAQVPSELLNSWENRVEILESKYLEVLDILENDIIPRAERLLSTLNEDTTD